MQLIWWDDLYFNLDLTQKNPESWVTFLIHFGGNLDLDIQGKIEVICSSLWNTSYTALLSGWFVDKPL